MATQSDTIDPSAATEQLRASLTRAGIVLPSLGLDDGGPYGLINLGRVRSDVAIRLAARLDKTHEAAPSPDTTL
ncbi:hypothetical protein ABZ734_27260 [Streptomyces sp. NPDC006660]|uniref:hypothetical protein n=1 Tax=Streptomyces sp. NPDC006660 TaxID=3156901 RepID=UPI0033EC7BC6